MIRHWIDALFPKRTARRWVLSGFIRKPFGFPLALLRSIHASRKLVGRVVGLPVRIQPGQRFLVRRHKNAKVRFSGILEVGPWGHARAMSSISVAKGASLELEGDFAIGQNVHISVGREARLQIGGVRNSGGSGITCDSKIMVAETITIGSDCIIAWGVFITDSDWHEMDGSVRKDAVSIGDHVWIAHDCSILRGSTISAGSVVAAKSLVCAKFLEEKVLLAGIPTKIIRRGVSWSR